MNPDEAIYKDMTLSRKLNNASDIGVAAADRELFCACSPGSRRRPTISEKGTPGYMCPRCGSNMEPLISELTNEYKHIKIIINGLWCGYNWDAAVKRELRVNNGGTT